MKRGDTLQERIKKLRKALGLTQQEFADHIGIKRNTVATYEIGRNVPLDPVIKSICREFNVNETWLRTGDGDMFVPRSREDELAAFMEQLLQSEPDDIRRRFVSAISRLSTKELEVLEKAAMSLVEEIPKQDKNTDPTDLPAIQTIAPPPNTQTDEQIDQEVERYRQQLLFEKKMDSQASSAKESGVG